MAVIQNIAAYQFATLTDLKPLRERLLLFCKQANLRGTILLSTEGINLFIAGEEEPIARLLAELRAIPGLENLTPKVSLSDQQPFRRMLVRIKKEIIAFGVPEINPAVRTSPKLPAAELKRWLDEGRPITLLDTRNDYEYKLGTFTNAVTLPIDHFREFPQAVRDLPPDWKSRPIVMFCTGGIRCEKAGPFMEREGFEHIYQLEGGILKYFEECGSAHYDGECFVFDQRVGLDPSLAETDSTQCYACQAPLTEEEQHDPRYEKGVSCPYCFQTEDEEQAAELARHQEAIVAATHPLPGSAPYTNYRPLFISAEFDQKTLGDFLNGILPHISPADWERTAAEDRLLNANYQPVRLTQIVRAGERYLQAFPQTQEPDVNPDLRILYEDRAILVLHKPAPLPLHPSGRFHRNTVQYILQEVYHPFTPRPVHRLDANTSGIAVFAKTKHFASQIQPQFARGEVEKTYLARIQGHPPEDRFSCELPISATAGELGSRTIDHDEGLPSRTDFAVLKRFADGTSLVEVWPRTGRTNQIRVHLWQLGWPICGEQSYLPQQQLGTTQTHGVEDAPLCLFAWKIAFRHPLTRQRVEFSAELPPWGVDSSAATADNSAHHSPHA